MTTETLDQRHDSQLHIMKNCRMIAVHTNCGNVFLGKFFSSHFITKNSLKIKNQKKIEIIRKIFKNLEN